MRSAGVITSQSAGEQFASSWELLGADWKVVVERVGAYPCFRVLKQIEPAIYDTMMSHFVAAIRTGESESEALAEVSEIAGNLASRYMPAASDEAVLATRDQWIAILTRYKDKDSRACIAFLNGAKIEFQRAFPDWNMTNTLLVMEKVIVSGNNKAPVVIGTDVADSDLNTVLRRIEARYGDDVKLLTNQPAWPDNARKACEMLLLFCQEIAKLPNDRSANLLRQLTMSE
jgi:hypothetical protein